MLRLRWLSFFLVPAALASGCGKEQPGTGGGGSGGSGGSPAVDACANVASLRASCQALPERFDTSTTLAKGCYTAAKSPILGAGVTLTLSPGTTILFADGTGLDVNADQALVARGTATEPICLTGQTAARGSWKGLVLGRTEGADDALDHVTIEYAGSTKSDAEAAAVKVASDSRAVKLSITNTTLRESQGYGLYLVASADLSAFSSNTFTKNMLGPASVDSDVAGLLDATSKYVGNDVDEVTVRTNRVGKNLTWSSLGVPFHLTGNLHVDAPWVLTAPNTLVMSADSWISVDGDAAALTAVGTADKPIVITGEQKQRGYWDSLRFGGTNNAANHLDYVTVEYGGATTHDDANAGVKATADSHGVTLGITHSTFHENQGYGLYLSGSATLSSMASNTFDKNGLGPVNVGSQAAHQLETSSTYTGNDIDRIRVRDDRVGKAVTWQDLGVPYELESNIHVDLVWTLAPGVTLLLAKDTWIHVGSDASALHAVGTAQKPITISGVQKTAGFWHSIVFDGSNNGANAIENAIIEYGGSLGGGGELGMIQAQADSHGVTMSVKSSTIRNSGQYGIWLGHFAQYNGDIESSNTFSGNASGNVFKQP